MSEKTSAIRTETKTGNGMNKLEIQLVFDNEVAQQAALKFFEAVKCLTKYRDAEGLQARFNWLNGYITGMSNAKVVDKQQARLMAEMAERTAKQQAARLGVGYFREREV